MKDYSWQKRFLSYKKLGAGNDTKIIVSAADVDKKYNEYQDISLLNSIAVFCSEGFLIILGRINGH